MRTGDKLKRNEKEFVVIGTFPGDKAIIKQTDAPVHYIVGENPKGLIQRVNKRGDLTVYFGTPFEKD